MAMGACMFTLVSQFGFARADQARVAASVASGVGFIGAGVRRFFWERPITNTYQVATENELRISHKLFRLSRTAKMSHTVTDEIARPKSETVNKLKKYNRVITLDSNACYSQEQDVQH